MAVTRDSLRSRSQAERDFYAPMTGGTEIRYAAAPTPIQSTYGSSVKDRLSDIRRGPRTTAPIIKAIKTKMIKTDDPFTQIAEQKSYVPQEENQIGAQIEGLADAAQDAINEGASQVEEIRRSSGQRKAERRALRQQERQDDLKARKAATDERAALKGDMKKLFERDKRMYGNTVPKGSFGSGSKPGPAVDTNVSRHSVGTSKDQPKRGVGQGSSVAVLGRTTRRQGEKPTGPAVKVTNYKDIRTKRLKAREDARTRKKITPKDREAINKGIAAAIKTGIPNNVAVQGGAMSQAARDQAAINKGIKAAEATGIPNNVAVQGGAMSQAARDQAAKNKAEAKAKAMAKAKAASAAKAKKAAESKRAAAAAAKAKAEGKTKAQQQAAARKAAGPNRTMSHGQKTRAQAGPSARTAKGNRARVKSNARKRAQAAARKRRKNRGRNKRCDIFLKYDISLLTNNNLHHDELAEVAYFVRALREIES